MTEARWLELWSFAALVAARAHRIAPWLERDDLRSQGLEVLVSRELRGSRPVRVHRRMVAWIAADLLRAQPELTLPLVTVEELAEYGSDLRHDLTPEFACLLREETSALEGAGRDGEVSAFDSALPNGCLHLRAGAYHTEAARLVMFL